MRSLLGQLGDIQGSRAEPPSTVTRLSSLSSTRATRGSLLSCGPLAEQVEVFGGCKVCEGIAESLSTGTGERPLPPGSLQGFSCQAAGNFGADRAEKCRPGGVFNTKCRKPQRAWDKLQSCWHASPSHLTAAPPLEPFKNLLSHRTIKAL